MRRLLFTFAVACTLLPLEAQDTLTLGQCIRMGIENNLQLKARRNEVAKGGHSISENRAKLLPQINAVVQMSDNFNPPVSVTDGSAYGNKYNVTKTLQYNASAALQLQMPLYNRTLLTALEITKMTERISRLSYDKARDDLMVQIARMYYLAQSTAEQIAIVKANIGRMEELRNIAVAFFDNGMAMDVDVKRVSINLENLRVQYDNATAMLAQQMNMLKYVIDYPADREIAVTQVSPDTVETVEPGGLCEQLPELQLLHRQGELAGMQQQMIRQGYLPSLTLTGNLAYSAFTDKLHNWFHSGPSNRWYNSSGLGITLRVPVFDGFERRSKIRKAKLDAENARLAYDDAVKSLRTQYMNSVNDLMNSRRNFTKQRDNYRLAEDVYAVTSDRYREGIASMTEVLQDEMSMSEAQNNYVTAHYDYRITNLMLLKLSGRLGTLAE